MIAYPTRVSYYPSKNGILLLPVGRYQILNYYQNINKLVDVFYFENMIPMKKLAVKHLEIGMKIVKIDKKWLDTPFLKHTFIIKSEKILAQLQHTCEYVFIENPQPLKPIKSDNLDAEKRGKAAVSHSYKLLNVIFDEMKSSSYLSSYKIKDVVNSLTIQVLADSKTYEYLSSIQTKSPCIAQKSIRVLILYLTLCKYVGIKKDKLLSLGCAALLHDVGMIDLPIKFNKTGNLTTNERELVLNHTQLGVNLIEKNKKFPSLVSQIIKSHHENFNGSGYPAGLAGRNINLYSRMLTVVCTYEALTRNRGYKSAMTSYAAIAELTRVSGSMLDPRLVARFIEVIREFPIGTHIRTNNGENVKILAKIDEKKYQVAFLSADNCDCRFVLNSDEFEGVIYE